MTDSRRDPIADAVEGVCGKFEQQARLNTQYLDELCINCGAQKYRHWLRALREKLAETERERDQLREELAIIADSSPDYEGNVARAALAATQTATTETSDD